MGKKNKSRTGLQPLVSSLEARRVSSLVSFNSHRLLWALIVSHSHQVAHKGCQKRNEAQRKREMEKEERQCQTYTVGAKREYWQNRRFSLEDGEKYDEDVKEGEESKKNAGIKWLNVALWERMMHEHNLFFLGSNDFFFSPPSVVYHVCTCCSVDLKLGKQKERHTESWEHHSSNRPHLSLKWPLISFWLMAHRAIMVPYTLNIHLLPSPSNTPGEKPQQCELSRHPKTALSLSLNSNAH